MAWAALYLGDLKVLDSVGGITRKPLDESDEEESLLKKRQSFK